jgi:hypothetical protein
MQAIYGSNLSMFTNMLLFVYHSISYCPLKFIYTLMQVNKSSLVLFQIIRNSQGNARTLF